MQWHYCTSYLKKYQLTLSTEIASATSPGNRPWHLCYVTCYVTWWPRVHLDANDLQVKVTPFPIQGQIPSVFYASIDALLSQGLKLSADGFFVMVLGHNWGQLRFLLPPCNNKNMRYSWPITCNLIWEKLWNCSAMTRLSLGNGHHNSSSK